MTIEPPPKNLIDRVRDVIRVKHYSYKTEQSYVNWIVRYILYHNKRHPQEMGSREIEEFLTHLAVERNVAASTQNQALQAILFLYREVLRQELDLKVDAVRAKRSKYLPTVLSKDEVLSIIGNLQGTYQLVAKMLYGTGLRLTEVLQLRIKDLDFAHFQIVVRDTKGMESRVTMLPNGVVEELKLHLERVKLQHQQDLTQGYGSVYLPFALERKYPHAGYEWSWQFVFPSGNISTDPRTGIVHRHYLHESGLQKAMKQAVRQSEITKRVSCHTFRHSLATHLLQNGVLLSYSMNRRNNLCNVQNVDQPISVKMVRKKENRTTFVCNAVVNSSMSMNPNEVIARPSNVIA